MDKIVMPDPTSFLGYRASVKVLGVRLLKSLHEFAERACGTFDQQ
jgi:hypothetical protein